MNGPPPYLKHFRLTRFPFRQQADPEVFFPQAGRDRILQDLCADIIDGKSLLKLTGTEGTGKTLLYLLLARKLKIKKFYVICLERPLGSFEELLRLVLMALGQGTDPTTGEDTGAGGNLPQLLTRLREKKAAGQRVALLIDEAEQLFLATLERLVRLVAEIREEGLLSILLVGRPELDRNLEQLSGYCQHVDMQAGSFLAPFDFSETESYLGFRLIQAGCPADKASEVFSNEAISALYREARGNLSLTHLLAERGLARAYETGMFQVSAELISPRQDRLPRSPSAFGRLGALLSQYRIQVLAGAVLALILLLIAFWPVGDQRVSSSSPEPAMVTAEKQEPASEVATPKRLTPGVDRTAAPGTGATGPLPAEGEESSAPAVSTPAPPASEGEPTVAPPTSSADAAEAIQARGGNIAPVTSGPPAQTAAGQTPPVTAPSPPAASEKQIEPLPEPVVLEQRATPPVTVAEMSVSESLPAKERKIVVLQAQARKRKVGAEPVSTVQPAVRNGKEQQMLFAERMRASNRWRARSGYTIQIMVLASEAAEENFKGLLAQPQYAAVKDQLYLVRKAVPPTLYIYYGFFATMEEARQGRDRLPDFLRKNQPYPLSIGQAAKKAND